jgi:hypothetical protein
MKSSDYEVYEIPERKASDPSSRPSREPSSRPAWLFRIIFITITLVALLLTPVVIQNIVESREDGRAAAEATPEEDSVSIATSSSEAATEPGSADYDIIAQPEAEMAKEETAEAKPIDEPRPKPTAQHYDLEAIQSIIDEQRRFTSAISEVYWAITTAQYNMARMLHQIAGIERAKSGVSARSPQTPKKKEDGPYYFWETTFNGNAIIDASKALLNSASISEAEKNERLKNYPVEAIDEYMHILRIVPEILIRSLPYFYPQMSHEEQLMGQMAAHRIQTRTGHILVQSEQAYGDVVAYLNEILAKRGRPEDYRRVTEIKMRYENATKGSKDTIALLAARMDSAVLLMGVLVTP